MIDNKLTLIVLLSLSITSFSACKSTSKLPKRGTVRPLNNAPISKSQQLRLTHNELIRGIFASAREDSPEELRKLLLDRENLKALQDDFSTNKIQWDAAFDGLASKKLISPMAARAIKKSLADFVHFNGSRVNAVGNFLPFTPSVEKELTKSADRIHKALGPELREKGLKGTLSEVFKPMIDSLDPKVKPMFDVTLDYYETFLGEANVGGPDANGQARAELDPIQKKELIRKNTLNTIEDITLGVLNHESNRLPDGKPGNLLTAALGRDSVGNLDLKIEEISSRGFYKLIERSGPVMQKIMQTFILQMPAEFQESMKGVQDKLPPMSSEVVTGKIKALDIQLPDGYSWPSNNDFNVESFNNSQLDIKDLEKIDTHGNIFRRNLGTASLSDSYGLYIKNPSGQLEEIAVKFIKDGVKENYAREIAIFNNLGEANPQGKKLIDFYVESVKEELQLDKEILNMQAIQKSPYYNGEVSLGNTEFTPYKKMEFKVISEPKGMIFSAPGNDAMLMTKASGKPLKTHIAERSRAVEQSIANLKEAEDLAKGTNSPELNEAVTEAKIKSTQAMDKMQELKIIMEKIHSNWMMSAFNDGVFHPDPHGGNVFIDFSSDVKPIVTYIDLGGTVRITESTRKSYLNLLTAVEVDEYPKVLRSMKELCELQCRHLGANSLDAKGSISRIMNNPKYDTITKLGKILALDDLPGFKFTTDFQDLSKGSVIMTKNTQDVFNRLEAAIDRHPIFSAPGKYSGTADFGEFNKSVVKHDLYKPLRNQYIVDALTHSNGNKVDVNKRLGWAALGAATLGVLFRDEVVEVFALNGASASCTVNAASVSICIEYDSLGERSLEQLKNDCSEVKKGVWTLGKALCTRPPWIRCKGSESPFIASKNLRKDQHKILCDKFGRP